MKENPQVAVVIIGWNNRSLLGDCLNSVKNQTYDNVRTIYVDNGSADDSVKYVQKNFSFVVVIDTGFNNGFAKGNNIGFKEALNNPACKYVVALNTDALLEPNWIEELVEFSIAHPDSACLQGLTLIESKRDYLDSRGIYIDMNAAPLQRDYNQPRKQWPDGEIFGVNAAAAMYTRSFLDAQPFGTDYFDSDLFMYYEDVDISARALTLGFSNYYHGDAIAYHMGSASSGGNPAFTLRMCHRNLPLVLVKNLPWSIIFACLPGWTKAEYLRVINFIREGRYDLARIIIVGRLSGLVLLPKFILKRRRLFKVHRPDSARYRKLMQ